MERFEHVVLQGECPEAADQIHAMVQYPLSGGSPGQLEHRHAHDEGDDEGQRPGKDEAGAGANRRQDQNTHDGELQDRAQAASPQLRPVPVESYRCPLQREPGHGRDRPHDEQGGRHRVSTDERQARPEEGGQSHRADRQDKDDEPRDRQPGGEEDPPLPCLERFDLRQEEERDPERPYCGQEEGGGGGGGGQSDVPSREEVRRHGPVDQPEHGNRTLLGHQIPEGREEASSLRHRFRSSLAEPIPFFVFPPPGRDEGLRCRPFRAETADTRSHTCESPRFTG